MTPAQGKRSQTLWRILGMGAIEGGDPLALAAEPGFLDQPRLGARE